MTETYIREPKFPDPIVFGLHPLAELEETEDVRRAREESRLERIASIHPTLCIGGPFFEPVAPSSKEWAELYDRLKRDGVPFPK